MKEKLKKLFVELTELRHYKAGSAGLWCIDRNPCEVSKEWIEKYAFRLYFKRTDNVLLSSDLSTFLLNLLEALPDNDIPERPNSDTHHRKQTEQEEFR
jgi:hypothetical protein